MFCWRSRRRSPSTWRLPSMYPRSFVISSSVRSRTFSSAFRPSSAHTWRAVDWPIPKMYVRPISSRFCGGMLTPAILAIAALALPLLVAGIRADDHGPAVPLDHAAALAHRLDGRSNLQLGSLRLLVAVDDPAAREVVR